MSVDNTPIRVDDLLRNHVKEKLQSGGVVASMTVRLVRGTEIALIAKTAGFDSLYVDLEHASFSLETASQICIAALAVGVTPFVRVPSVAAVARTLDGGALGIIAPHVRSAAQAREYVRAAKFPPLGERSAAGPLPHLHYRSFSAAQSNAALDAATMVIVQFESDEALTRADEIASVDGVDMVMVGTNDLLADWGLPGQYEHPRVREAYAKTIAVCRQHGKYVAVGGLSTRPQLAAEFVRMGARYVSTGTDLGFLLCACAAKAEEVRQMTFDGNG
ncbi:MAG TPA: aldolase/citrate lyase family protein [Xanthobacteraceae bacterium]|jgi:2-keto-3-deoxy-L-rhamnonate aldolase RhmA